MSMEVLLQNKWICVCITQLLLEEVLRRLTPKIKGASGGDGQLGAVASAEGAVYGDS